MDRRIGRACAFRIRRELVWLVLATMCVCGSWSCDQPEQTPHTPTATANAKEAAVIATDERQAVNILWFGHSLVQRPFDHPPLDLPALVDELHRAAREDGRTAIPEGRSRAFVLQSKHLGRHLEEGSRDKLRASKPEGITHVVGIGFMHMLGVRAFEHPTVTYWLHRALPARFDSPRLHTEHIYRFIEDMRRELPSATWVSYIGPALSSNLVPQPYIDARYACIEHTARSAGASVLSAPVGRAFRNVEQTAQARPELAIRLQQPDGLHLTAQGALLAATVLYTAIYGVDPVGLRVPESTRVGLHAKPELRPVVAQLLQETARDTVLRYAPTCSEGARLPEDEQARNFLSAGF